MPVVKFFCRTVIFTLLFFIIYKSEFVLMNFIDEKSLTIKNIMNYDDVENFKVILVWITLPFFISSILHYYYHNNITQIIYCGLSFVPIVIFIYGANMITSGFNDLKKYFYLLIPLFLILAFYYNYKLMSKELEKKNENK